ncbi:PH domain-containing protein [Cellulomonas endophytica]|uniref:PH domain-containing protein n=1 Tax=Cellulomonas endophytica TaxID=2494735 RepID=UPI001011BA5B|nr:PH domain-containing protein [Cellulomonas endophytica]
MSTEDVADAPVTGVPGGPFDPAGVRWTPVSPRLAAARLTALAIGLAVPLVVLVGVALLVERTWAWVLPAGLLVLGLWPALLVGRQVAALQYAEREDDLLIRRGILFRSLVVVPYGRMQYVDVSAGPLARRFGIASVQLHTASVGTDASIDGLPPAEAARLRDRLAGRGEARLAGL